MARKGRSDSQDEAEIRVLIERWAEAVRRHDRKGILTDHDPDILLFDVPPPLSLKGMAKYRRSWDLFFSWHRPSDAFDVRQLDIVAGSDVAFAVALMRCGGTDEGGVHSELDFRLTIGLRKAGGRWRVVHEHHSVPAD